MNIIIFKKFLNPDVCQLLNNWVDLAVNNHWMDKGRDFDLSHYRFNHKPNNYKYRLTSRIYANRYKYPEIVYKVSNQISGFLQIQDLEKSVVGGGRDGIVVSCMLPDGKVSAHIDDMEGSLHILRCNIMTRKSDFGGELYIGERKINIDVGDLHCYLPSLTMHKVTVGQGETSRVMWMFGYQCSLDRFNQIVDQNLNANNARRNLEHLNGNAIYTIPEVSVTHNG